MSKADYGSVFGDTPLNDPAMLDGGTPSGHVTPSAPPPGASQAEVLQSATELICIWRDPAADITGLQVTVARVDPAVAKAYLAGLTAKGYTCGEAHSGLRCGLIKPNATYPVDEGYTSFLRDDIYIDVSQANFPTNDLIGKIVGTLWG
ncbi:MAG: hypothetical protein JWM49_1450 [Microbacteriaceae bacterium]|nr:hypothetical protein [Microbacteriaceae bacterium]